MCYTAEDIHDLIKRLQELDERMIAKHGRTYFACEIQGFCPYNNSKEGFPCDGCPYEKDGGYSDDIRRI